MMMINTRNGNDKITNCIVKEKFYMNISGVSINKLDKEISVDNDLSYISSGSILELIGGNLEVVGLENSIVRLFSDQQQSVYMDNYSPMSEYGEAKNSEQPSDDPESAHVDESVMHQRWKALCSQLLSVGEEAVSDVDLLTLLLSYLNSAVNARKLAMQLISRFETFGNVVSARYAQIRNIAEIEPTVVEFLQLIRAAGTRLAREEISHRPVIDAWDKLLVYLRSTMAHQAVEQFRVLFLDRSNALIADEVQHRGTIDHTPVYPREVVKRALEFDASAIIMVHNHPSNQPAPSKADIEMTRVVRDAVERLGIVLHDHIIISRRGHSSFRAMGLLGPKAGQPRLPTR